MLVSLGWHLKGLYSTDGKLSSVNNFVLSSDGQLVDGRGPFVITQTPLS